MISLDNIATAPSVPPPSPTDRDPRGCGVDRVPYKQIISAPPTHTTTIADDCPCSRLDLPIVSEGGLEYRLRGFMAADWPLVAHSYKRCMQDTRLLWGQLDRRLEKMQERGRFVVACAPDDETLIFGWACGQGPLLHFVFVKQAFRKQGIAGMLWHALEKPLYATHWTTYAKRVGSRFPILDASF